MLTSRITPKISDSPAANMAYSPPSSTPCRMVFTHSTSDSEISRGDFLPRQRFGLALQRDAALLQAIDVARGLQRLHDVLLDDDKRQALGGNRRNAGVDVADHDRREAQADLVAQQEPRVRHQRAADRDHLLL